MTLPESLFLFLAFIASIASAQEKRIMDCTIYSTSLDECDPTNYLMRVGVFAAPGLVMFVFLLICCPLYCGGKYCCNCCGGRKQSPNFCCPNTKYPARYSKGDIARPKVFIVLSLVFTAGAIGYGYFGGSALRTGLFDLVDAVNYVPTRLTNSINDIDAALTVQRYNASTGLYQTERIFAGSEVSKNANATKADMEKIISGTIGEYTDYINYAATAILAILVLPVILTLIGTVTAFGNCRRCCPMCLVWLLFFSGLLMWLTHGIFSAFSLAIGDACAEIKGVAAQQTNILPTLLKCDNAQFGEFKSNFKAMEVSEAESACQAVANLCYRSSLSPADNAQLGTVWACPSSLACTGMSFVRLLPLINTFTTHPNIYNDPALGIQGSGYVCDTGDKTTCSINRCSTECRSGGTLSTTGRTSVELKTNFEIAHQVSLSMDTLGAQYASCEAIFDILLGGFAAPCTSISDGLVVVRRSSGVEGVMILFAIFALAWGAKRFISFDEVDEPQMEGVDGYDEAQAM